MLRHTTVLERLAGTAQDVDPALAQRDELAGRHAAARWVVGHVPPTVRATAVAASASTVKLSAIPLPSSIPVHVTGISKAYGRGAHRDMGSHPHVGGTPYARTLDAPSVAG
ncbi:hypothetical protein GCM10023198_07430 [Promicromonospora umidemergens]|uniref:Uncharacterized protein n=1 Tax=Promicromonospora umidemergens TaxID=629679 RepID=A0ABP8WNU5_9MICO